MISKSYKFWIIFFVIINFLLLTWSLGYFKFLEKKFTAQDNVVVIEPNNVFKKTLPPKDESFPNEKSKLWGAFEDKLSKEEILQNNLEVENFSENKNEKLENTTDLDNSIENKNKNLVQNKQNDLKSIEKNQILKEKNSSEEKKINNDIKTDEPQIKFNDSLTENILDEVDFFYVQVASLSKEHLVEKEWTRFKKKYPEYVSNLTYMTQKAELKDNRVFFRLLVGKFRGKKEANNFCDKIRINKCIIKKKNE